MSTKTKTNFNNFWQTVSSTKKQKSNFYKTYHGAILGHTGFGLEASGDAHEQRSRAQLHVCVVVEFLDAWVGVRAVVALGETVVAMSPQRVHVLLVEMGSLVLWEVRGGLG